MNGFREPILFSSPLDETTGHKLNKKLRIGAFKKTILSHITFNREDGNHKQLDFKGRRITFTCQLIKT